MKNKISFVPKGYNIITPYLIVNNATKAIVFYKNIFGAEEIMKMVNEGKVRHAELKIGDSKIMLADEYPELEAHSPSTYGGSPISLHVYVADVEATAKKAVAAGAKLKRPVEKMFYGDVTGTIEDPFGHTWFISTHVEDVTMDELKKRASDLAKKTH